MDSARPTTETKENSFQRDLIVLDVQGTLFKSTRDVFYRSEFLKTLIEWQERESKSQPYFLNKSSLAFAHVISFLTDSTYQIPGKFYYEMRFYQIPTFVEDPRQECAKRELQYGTQVRVSTSGDRNFSIRIPRGLYTSLTITRNKHVLDDIWEWVVLLDGGKRQIGVAPGRNLIGLDVYCDGETPFEIEFVCYGKQSGAVGGCSPFPVELWWTYHSHRVQEV